MYRSVALACAAAFASLVLTGCSAAPTSPSSSSSLNAASPATESSSASGARALTAGNGFEIQTTFTAAGNLNVGSIATLNFTVTNISGVDDPYGTFGWLLLSNQVKRTQTPTTTNPLVLCEAYRGHQGGLSQTVYDDFCRVWFSGPIAAGQSVNLAFPIKLLSEGTWSVVAENSWGVPDAQGYYPNIVRMPLDLVVGPALPKVGGGGGGTTSGLPDIQATARASSGSVAAGAQVALSFSARNSGKVNASNVPFTATLPAGATLVSSADAQGQPCSVAGAVVRCTIPQLLVGQTSGLVLNVAMPASLGSYAFPGTFGTPTEGDSNLSNNSATLSVSVK